MGQKRIPEKCITVLKKKALKIMSFAPFKSYWLSYFYDIEDCAIVPLVFKGELRPKLQPCFYVRFLLIVWRKSVVQSFVATSADFTKL